MKLRLVIAALLLMASTAHAQSPEAQFILGPQVPVNTATNAGALWFDQNAIDRGLSLCAAFPDAAHTPGNVLIAGTVSVTAGSKTVRGVGTSFTTATSDYAIISNGPARIIKIIGSIQSNTELTLTLPWEGQTLTGQSMSSPSATEVDNYAGYTNYYDFVSTQYVNYYRTNDQRFLDCARKAADSWWSQPIVDYGKNLYSVSGNSYAPRSAALNGLMLRALDGRPEMWPWITDYVRESFRNWVEVPTGWAEANPATAPLYFGIRDGGFMLLYAANLAAVHPDATVRAEFRAKVLRSAVNYYAALQKPDGSYRWNDDGFPFNGSEQPFQVGILNEGMIAVHRLTGDERVKAAILKSVDHEYARSYSRTWGGLYYFIHGTIGSFPAVDCENGCGAAANPFPPSDTSQITEVRQLNATAIHQFGYAFAISGDPKYRSWGDEVFATTYSGADGFRGLAATRGKEYSESYRSGPRYLAWRLGGTAQPSPSPTPLPSPSPTPTPTPVPSPSPTPTPQPCSISAPDFIVIPRNKTSVVNVTLQQMTSEVTVNVGGSTGQVTVTPLSQTVKGTSAVLAFKVSVKRWERTINFDSQCGSRAVEVRVFP